MADRFRIFLGSSSETLDLARAVQDELADVADVTRWDQGVFSISQPLITELFKAVEAFDGAVFLFTPDDALAKRGEIYTAARSNVTLELGMFIGKLGLDRVFVVAPSDCQNFDVPTDLDGLILARYRHNDSNIKASLTPACNRIRDKLRALGTLRSNRGIGSEKTVAAVCFRPREGSNEVEFVLVRSSQERRIFPKTRIDELEDPISAAKRCAHDEAGVIGDVICDHPVCVFKHLKEQRAVQHIAAYILDVRDIVIPKSERRQPEWFTLQEAEKEISKQMVFVYAQEMKKVLQNSIKYIQTNKSSTFSFVEQAGVIPYRKKNDYFELLLVTSLRGGNWIFPKGGVDSGNTPLQQARWEALEEAGIEGEIRPNPLHQYDYRKSTGELHRVWVFPMLVTRELDKWPEQSYRRRKWYSTTEAYHQVGDDELRNVIQKFMASNHS